VFGGGGKCGRSFGGVEVGVGAAADFVGVDADWREDEGALRKVGFVMKDGRVWKEGGRRWG
jgi:imidazolonepropionase-like amidohydrolase